MLRNVIFAFSLLSFIAHPSFAAAKGGQPKKVATHKDWSVFSTKQGGKKVHYMVSYPKQKKGKYSKRGDVYMLVTNRPGEKSYNVVSFHAGFPFKAGATADVYIDGKKFTAFAHGETLWFPDDVDRQVSQALGRGNKVVVKSKSSRGTEITDTYSLAGSSAAKKTLDRISKG